MNEGSRQTAAPADVPQEAEVQSTRAASATTAPCPEGVGGASPARVGDYQVLGLIGEGGMGTVFRARQERPRREVALKLVRSGFATEKLRRRFEHEAEVLGRLQHDGIARIYEAGIDPATNQPFFAMELIEGERLDEWAARLKPDLEQRLRMVMAMCEAVHYAHTKGVIHRDLKPANILVTCEGKPKILDFGVARLADADATLYTRETQTGQVLGTVAYMSPEQAAGNIEEIDTRSDVYALGVIAYELLSGKMPLAVAGKPLAAAVRVIAEEEPSRLSIADRSLRGDVETIVGKALAKEKESRYDSAASLAGDIKRYLEYEPITARPPSTWYNLRKFARRNKAVVGGVVASFLILLAGAATSTVFAIRANQQAALAEQRELQAQDAAKLAEERRVLVEEREQETVMAQELVRMGDYQYAFSVDFKARSRINVNTATSAVRRMLAERRRALGDDNPLTVTAMDILGHLLYIQGRFEEAAPYIEEALDKRTRRLGSDHPETAVSVAHMAQLLIAQGNFANAEPYCRSALRARRRWGAEWQTVDSLRQLSSVLRELGQLEEAEKLAAEAVEISARGYRSTAALYNRIPALLAIGRPGPSFVDATVLGEHANILALMNRFAEAEPRALAAEQAFATLEAEVERMAMIRQIISLYDNWHAAESELGYDFKASEWRATLAHLEVSREEGTEETPDEEVSPHRTSYFRRYFFGSDGSER